MEALLPKPTDDYALQYAHRLKGIDVEGMLTCMQWNQIMGT